MIPLPPILATNWRAIAVLVVVGALGAGLLWYRSEAAVAELETAKAHNALAEMIGVDTKGQWSARAVLWAGRVLGRTKG